MPAKQPLIAVDIGNSRMKFGLFSAGTGEKLPTPTATREIETNAWEPVELAEWLAENDVARGDWVIGSVHRSMTEELRRFLKQAPCVNELSILRYEKMPLVIAVDHPEKVGLDRLAGGVAANALRKSSRPAIVMDLGSALTVDWISADGAFQGGAILPGIGMSAKALHQFTDQLPLIPMTDLAEPPAACGKNTADAMCSGLYWGAVGAMRELIQRLSASSAEPPDIFLTGGAAPAVAEHFEPVARFVPHLVLSGLALSVAR